MEPGTPMHCPWRCPCLPGLYLSEEDATQRYADKALDEPEFECFLLRGLLPSSRVEVPAPDVDDGLCHMVGPTPLVAWWPLLY